MQCPRCQGELRPEELKGIEVDRCASCHGLWLDYAELDQLEDRVLDDDHAKGSLMFRSFRSDLACPRCQQPMQAFNYRAYDLELDFCENQHGWWLDRGEEERVLQIMERRIKDLHRTGSAEQEWARFLQNTKSKSFLKKMRGLFR
ncbi:MAG: zf-TFIIB domain-containing protein [Chloroflexi bacterium]|nr:zf-TFIIB domain-containing protein [Chloroflexota bacterium]